MVVTRTVPVVDADSHIIEPRDLFTSRISSRWGDLVPHVLFDDEASEEAWYIGDEKIAPAWGSAASGYEKKWPPYPRTEADINPAATQAKDRAKFLDGEGIDSQVLYPNVAGFGGQRFLKLKEPELMLASVRAYNDFLVEWSAEMPGRFIPIAALPFWDLDAAIMEARRAVEIGHKGILFSGAPQGLGFPYLADRHWDPLWSAISELGVSISIHLGSGDARKTMDRASIESRAGYVARVPTELFLGIGIQLNDILFSGVLARFPKLRFVMVESGVGAIPFILKSADYHFGKSSLRSEWPWYELKPSEYFRRQCYGTFWFEDLTPDLVEAIGAENLLFETDFPHTTSLREGEASAAIDRVFDSLPTETAEQVLWKNSNGLYN